MPNVGIVIVSHSAKIAEGAADMVRQMVGDAVPLAYTGGNAIGGLGTDVAAIMAAIDRAWSSAGVAVLVDLGGAETNSEMAIELLDHGRRAGVVGVQRTCRRGSRDGCYRVLRRLTPRSREAHSRRALRAMRAP